MKNIKENVKNAVESLIQNTEAGKKLILDSLAIIYLNLEKDENIEEYKILDDLFETLGVVPELDKNNLVIYNKNKSEENNFFKKKKKNISSGEGKLLQDLFYLTFFNKI